MRGIGFSGTVLMDDSMSFDELPFRRIPIWDTCHRLDLLRRFRNLLSEYAQLLETTNTPAYSAVARAKRQQIDQLAESARKNVRLANVSTIVSPAVRQAIMQKWSWHQISEQLDLIGDFFFFDIPGLRIEAVARVDRAKGVYEGNKRAAWFRTFWPFFWFGVFANWVADIPFKILKKLGFEFTGNASSRAARSLHGALALLVWAVGFGASVAGLLDFFGWVLIR
jgi:hypothetical protein